MSMETQQSAVINRYAPPELTEYGSVVALTGACDGPCIDGIPGGMNLIF